MKKLVSVFVVVMLLLSSACGGGDSQNKAKSTPKNEKKDILTADMLMTTEDVKALVSYEPVALSEKSAQKTVIRYDSDPVGKGDPVIIELYAPNSYQSESDIRTIFTKKKEKRPKAKDINDFGIEAYIAYPSVNMYRDGYMVVITAGSGAGDEQEALLKSAGTIAAGHLDEYIQAHPTQTKSPGAEDK